MQRWLAVAALTRTRVLAGLSLLLLLTGAYTRTQSQSVSTITPPSAEFGANIGDDYFLATYSQLETLLEAARAGVGPDSTRGHRPNRRRSQPVDGDHLVTRESPAARPATATSPVASPWPKG